MTVDRPCTETEDFYFQTVALNVQSAYTPGQLLTQAVLINAKIHAKDSEVEQWCVLLEFVSLRLDRMFDNRRVASETLKKIQVELQAAHTTDEELQPLFKFECQRWSSL